MATYCNTDPNCPAEIREALTRIERAAGRYAVSGDNPTGLAAYYDDGNAKPWRVADDHAHERYETADRAEVAAEDWAEAMSGD